jgi:hypothetical protein
MSKPSRTVGHGVAMLASKADFERAVIDLQKTVNKVTLQLTVAMIAIAGFAIAITF